MRLGARVAITLGAGRGAAGARDRPRHAHRGPRAPAHDDHRDGRALPSRDARRRRRHRPDPRGGGARRPDGRALRPDERRGGTARTGPAWRRIQSPTGRMDGISVEAVLGAAQALLR